MNSRNRKTLQAIFTQPTSKTLAWDDIESLLVAVGAIVSEGRGSRVKFDIGSDTLALHRPHNPKTARAYQVEMVREFLVKVGVRP